jgi:hypothetical protein
MLLVSIGFSAGGAMANHCQGGIDCLNCAAMAHGHMPSNHLTVGYHGCRPVGQNGSCGFETGHRPDKFDRIASTTGFGNFQHAGIFSAASDNSDQAHLYRLVIPPYHYPVLGELTPVYLLNQSLLC